MAPESLGSDSHTQESQRRSSHANWSPVDRSLADSPRADSDSQCPGWARSRWSPTEWEEWGGSRRGWSPKEWEEWQSRSWEDRGQPGSQAVNRSSDRAALTHWGADAGGQESASGNTDSTGPHSVPLVRFDPPGSTTMVLQPAGLAAIKAAAKPLRVAAFFGHGRVGKSLLASKCAGVDGAFDDHGGLDAKTEGIDVVVLPHASGGSLIIIDSEGSDNPLAPSRHCIGTLVLVVSSMAVAVSAWPLNDSQLQLLEQLAAARTVVMGSGGQDLSEQMQLMFVVNKCEVGAWDSEIERRILGERDGDSAQRRDSVQRIRQMFSIPAGHFHALPHWDFRGADFTAAVQRLRGNVLGAPVATVCGLEASGQDLCTLLEVVTPQLNDSHGMVLDPQCAYDRILTQHLEQLQLQVLAAYRRTFPLSDSFQPDLLERHSLSSESALAEFDSCGERLPCQGLVATAKAALKEKLAAALEEHKRSNRRAIENEREEGLLLLGSVLEAFQGSLPGQAVDDAGVARQEARVPGMLQAFAEETLPGHGIRCREVREQLDEQLARKLGRLLEGWNAINKERLQAERNHLQVATSDVVARFRAALPAGDASSPEAPVLELKDRTLRDFQVQHASRLPHLVQEAAAALERSLQQEVQQWRAENTNRLRQELSATQQNARGAYERAWQPQSTYLPQTALRARHAQAAELSLRSLRAFMHGKVVPEGLATGAVGRLQQWLDTALSHHLAHNEEVLKNAMEALHRESRLILQRSVSQLSQEPVREPDNHDSWPQIRAAFVQAARRHGEHLPDLRPIEQQLSSDWRAKFQEWRQQQHERACQANQALAQQLAGRCDTEVQQRIDAQQHQEPHHRVLAYHEYYSTEPLECFLNELRTRAVGPEELVYGPYDSLSRSVRDQLQRYKIATFGEAFLAAQRRAAGEVHRCCPHCHSPYTRESGCKDVRCGFMDFHQVPDNHRKDAHVEVPARGRHGKRHGCGRLFDWDVARNISESELKAFFELVVVPEPGLRPRSLTNGGLWQGLFGRA